MSRHDSPTACSKADDGGTDTVEGRGSSRVEEHEDGITPTAPEGNRVGG